MRAADITVRVAAEHPRHFGHALGAVENARVGRGDAPALALAHQDVVVGTGRDLRKV
jgi:hypothetical protein